MRIPPPIVPGTDIIGQSDISVICEKDGHVCLIWQLFDDTVKGCVPDNTHEIILGSRWRPLSNDFTGAGPHQNPSEDPPQDTDVLEARCLTNPKTLRQEVICVLRNGTVKIYDYDKAKSKVIERTTQVEASLCPLTQCRIVGYGSDQTAQDPMLLGILKTKDAKTGKDLWTLNVIGTKTALTLDIPAGIDAYSAIIGQWALSQRLYILSGHLPYYDIEEIEDPSKNDTSHYYYAKGIVYAIDIEHIYASLSDDATQATLTPLCLELGEEMGVQSDAFGMPKMELVKINPLSNDDQVVIHYGSGLDFANKKLTILEDSVADPNPKIRGTFSVESTRKNHQVQIWRMPKSALFIYAFPSVAYSNEQYPTYSIQAVVFDWEKSTFKTLSSLQFELIDKSIPSEAAGYAEYLTPLSSSAILRQTDKTTADLALIFRAKCNDAEHEQITKPHVTTFKIIWDGATTVTLPTLPKNESDLAMLDLNSLPAWPNFDSNFFTLGPNWTGKGFYYGHPTYDDTISFDQIFGLYQVPPFESSVSGIPSQITLSISSTVSHDNDVSTHSSLSKSVDESVNITFFEQSLSAHVNSTWTESYVKNVSEQSSTNLHLSATYTQEDMVHAHINKLTYWHYPIISSEEENRVVGELVIVTPKTPQKEVLR